MDYIQYIEHTETFIRLCYFDKYDYESDDPDIDILNKVRNYYSRLFHHINLSMVTDHLMDFLGQKHKEELFNYLFQINHDKNVINFNYPSGKPFEYCCYIRNHHLVELFLTYWQDLLIITSNAFNHLKEMCRYNYRLRYLLEKKFHTKYERIEKKYFPVIYPNLINIVLNTPVRCYLCLENTENNPKMQFYSCGKNIEHIICTECYNNIGENQVMCPYRCGGKINYGNIYDKKID